MSEVKPLRLAQVGHDDDDNDDDDGRTACRPRRRVNVEMARVSTVCDWTLAMKKHMMEEKKEENEET